MTVVSHAFHRHRDGFDEKFTTRQPGDREIYAARVCVSEESGEEKDISIQLVGTEGLRQSAGELINKRYGWRGYGSHHRLAETPAHTTFTASIDGEIVGTITLAVDSSSGLAADQIFQEEIDGFRDAPGAQVCELTKFAFETDMPSRPLLAALFHVVFIYGQSHYQCSDLFIEVNPRHRRFYEAMLGFERVGGLKTNESVDAPAQLMRLQVSRIESLIAAHQQAGAAASARSLYPHFMSPAEEAQVKSRLWRTAFSAGTSWRNIAAPDSARPGRWDS